MKNKIRFLATMLIGVLLSVNQVWGASPVTGNYSFGGSAVSGWTCNPQVTYCNLYYSGKDNTTATVKNTNISNIAAIDFSTVSNPSITITVSGICNTGGTNTYTVSLINSSGTVLVSSSAQSSKFGSGSSSSKAQSSTVTLTPVKGVTGYQITIGKRCCLTGTSYSLTYEEVTVTPVTSLILSEAGNETDLKSGKNVGDSYTLPSTTSASCGNKTFVGWSTVEIQNPGAKPTSNYYDKGAEVTLAANNTFYAVFADASGGGGVSGSVVVSYESTNFPTGYGTANTFTQYTLGGYKFQIQQVYKNGEKQQWRANGNNNGTGTIYNDEAFPAPISSIVIIWDDSDNNRNHTVKAGSSANPTEGTEISGTTTQVDDVYITTFNFGTNANNYFVLTNGTNAGYTKSFTINYGNPTTYSNYTTSCVSTYTLLSSGQKVGTFSLPFSHSRKL